MANLKDVIYLSNEDYETLVSTGTVTINGETLTYNENNVYVTPDKLASSTDNGLMSSSDKIKLDGIEAGAEANPSAYIKTASVSNNTLTLTKQDDTTVTYNEVFWAIYGTTTFAEIAAAIEAGKYVACKYNNGIYGNVMLHSSEGRYYLTCLYGSYTRRAVRCQSTSPYWSSADTTFLGGFTVDGTSRVGSNNGQIFTMNSNYDPSNNKLATASDLPAAANNGTLTIKAGTDSASTFTANQSGDTTLTIKGGGTTTVSKSANNEITITTADQYTGTLTGVSVNGTPASVSSGVANITSVPSSIVSGLGTAATKNTGTSSGDVPVLDSNGKLSQSVIPASAITETFVVSTESAMLALTAQVGDVCVRTDLNKSFILKEDGASTLAHWQELLTPTDAVQSVNGQTGTVVLDASSVGALPDDTTYVVSVNGSSGVITNVAVTNADNNFSTTQTFKDIVLYSASGDSPRLTFQRGTLSDNMNDWSVYDSGGYLYIQQRGSGSSSWETRATFTQSGVTFAGTVNGYTLNAASAKAVDTSISAGSTSTNLPTSAAVASFVEGKGYTTNTGTVTSVDNVSPTSGNVALSAVRYVSQSLSDAQKTQARTNIGAGTSNLTIGTTSTTAAAGNHTHSNYMPYGATIMETNPFGGKKLYINSLYNAFANADKKYYVTVTKHKRSDNGVDYPYVDSTKTITDDNYYVDGPVVADLTSSAHNLFNGSYEDGIGLENTGATYLKIRIMFGSNTSPSGTSSSWSGYPYGTWYLSFYYNNTPNVASQVRVYNKYAAHTVGWHLYNSTYFSGSASGTNVIQQISDENDYQRTCVDFIIYGNNTSGRTISLTQIDYKLSRPDLAKNGATLTAFGPMTIYEDFTWNYLHKNRFKITKDGVATWYATDGSTVKATISSSTGDATFKGTTDVSDGTLKLKTINAPTTSGGSTYGPGSNGQIIKSNGTSVYWADETTGSDDSWRPIQVDGTQKEGSGTNTNALNFISQNTNNGDVTFTYDSTNHGIKATAKIPSIPDSDSDLTNDRYVRYDIDNQNLSSSEQGNARGNIDAQQANANLNSLSALNVQDRGFVKKNGDNSFTIDTSTYLTTTGTAADSSKLNGQSASYYATAASVPTTADYVSKKANTTLNQDITTTWDTFGTRKITISGNSITLDMSADTGGWAGTFASFKDAISTSPMLGFYGGGSSGLNYAYMFGTYSDPAFKITKTGYATFKNKLVLTGGVASGDYTISIPSISANDTFALSSQIPANYLVSASKTGQTLTVTDNAGNSYSLTNSTYSVPNNATTGAVAVNNANTNGFWYISSGGTYTPPFKQVDNATGSDYRVLTTAYSTAWYQQIATDFRSNDIFVRRNQNGTLQPWTALVKLQPCSGTTTQTMPTITDNAIARFDTSRNATIQNSNVTIDDNGNIAGAGTINGYTLNAASAKAVDTSISAGSTSTNLPTSAAVASFVEGKITDDNNYYPTAMSWTNGTTSGPTATITMSGTNNISVGAIPAANGTTQSGIVTTGDQTFGGIKTFETSLKIHTPANQTDLGNELTTEIGADFINVIDHTNNETWRFMLPNLQDEDEQTLATMGNVNSIPCVKYTSQSLTTTQQAQARTNIGAGTLSSVKSLNTNNTSAQTASSSESLSGSGTINLHKVAKTGSYQDLQNLPGYVYAHPTTIEMSGKGGVLGSVSFTYFSSTDSMVTDIEEITTEVYGYVGGNNAIIPASGFIHTSSGEFVVYGVYVSAGELIAKVHKISDGSRTTISISDAPATFTCYDSVDPNKWMSGEFD